ncbi:group II intron, maturase-specific domain protein [Mycobacterium xenopi 3993]|nr:group II intron, maturase-specific domain protein [Mycobacterium xenopi 3993]
MRGWGNYFRTGNAADKFTQIDRYVWRRLFRLMVKKRAATFVLGKLISGLSRGSTGTACIDFVAPSVTRRLRNHV